MRFNSTVRGLCTAALLSLSMIVGSSTHALGAILTAGSVLIPATSEPDPLGGTLVATSGPVAFSAPGFFSGTLTTSVYSGDTTNTLGGLTFTYLLTNHASGPNSIGRLTVTEFDGFATDGSYQSTSLGIAPASIDRSLSGDVVGFNFLPTPIDPATGFLAPGTTTRLLVIQTDADFFAPNIANIIDGSITTATSFGPSIVPEPSTIALVIGGLVTFGVYRRRKAIAK